MSQPLLALVEQTSNFVQSELLEIAGKLVSATEPMLLCVYSREIGVCVYFHLFCTKIYIFLSLYCTSAFSLIMRKPRSHKQEHLHFIIGEVTLNILFYELDMLYILDYSRDYLYEMRRFVWFLIWYTSTMLILTYDYFIFL